MSSEKDLYILQDDADEEWVRPTPVRSAIVQTVAAETDLSTEEVEAAADAIPTADLRAVLETEREGELSFSLAGYDVTVDANGDITVA